MNAAELVKELKGILCWVPTDSTAASRIKNLIKALGGRVE